jgi:division protein CdvB (Snf7/Vps24/ESCRT-III family)
MERNHAAYCEVETTAGRGTTAFWKQTIRQLRPIAKQDCRKPELKIQGARLQVSIKLLKNESRGNPEQPSQATGAKATASYAAQEIPDILHITMYIDDMLLSLSLSLVPGL